METNPEELKAQVPREFAAPLEWCRPWNATCAWLLDRAEVTGSPYWWRQYDLCIGYF